MTSRVRILINFISEIGEKEWVEVEGEKRGGGKGKEVRKVKGEEKRDEKWEKG